MQQIFQGNMMGCKASDFVRHVFLISVVGCVVQSLPLQMGG